MSRPLVFGALFAAALVSSTFIGCSDDTPSAAGPSDAGPEIRPIPDSAPRPKDGAPDVLNEPNDPLDTDYPSDHAQMPLVDNNGGPIMESVKIVTVTFLGDLLRERLEEFGDTITSTDWWKAVTSEYCSLGKCVGPGSSGGHVVIQEEAKEKYSDLDIQNYLQTLIKEGTVPPPTKDVLYALYFPEISSITLDGQASCRDFGGYHSTMKLSAGTFPDGGIDATANSDGGAWEPVVRYAVMPRCGPEGMLTSTASHEFVEAVTDPNIGIDEVTYYMTNPVWPIYGGETADLCTAFNGDDSWTESGFTVQRSWSNKAAKAGKDPCVPTGPAEVYFSAAPSQQIISMAVGESKNVTVTAFSDGPFEEWSLIAFEASGLRGSNEDHLELSLDRSMVHNGEKAKLTITLKGKRNSRPIPYVLVSRTGNRRNVWVGGVLPK